MFDFDLGNPLDALRLICGLFLIPHAIAKVRSRGPVTEIFVGAGLKPPMPFIYLAMLVEWLAAIGLILGLYVNQAALLAAAFMAVAALASYRVSKGAWIWAFGGAEYPVFWGLCCLILAWFY